MTEFLAGRRILVTGAARGIGFAVATLALSSGARVALADIDAAECVAAAESLGGAAKGVVGLTMDVADPTSIAAAIGAVSEVFGGLDGLVNNAAILDESHAANVKIDRFSHVLSVNLTSVLRVSQAALPLFSESDSPAIVNTLSTQALLGQPNSVAYATAKGGGLSLTRAMAIDFAHQGVRVNAVAPGFIDTRMAITAGGEHEHLTDRFQSTYVGARKIPLARAGTPDDCAGAFIFLLSEQSLYVTGQVIAVDGGLTATY